MLNLLPPELCLDLLPGTCIVRLWLTGDSLMQAKLTQCSSFRFRSAHKQIPALWPSFILNHLKNLRRLYIDVEKNCGVQNMRLSEISKSLTSLTISIYQDLASFVPLSLDHFVNLEELNLILPENYVEPSIFLPYPNRMRKLNLQCNLGAPPVTSSSSDSHSFSNRNLKQTGIKEVDLLCSLPSSMHELRCSSPLSLSLASAASFSSSKLILQLPSQLSELDLHLKVGQGELRAVLQAVTNCEFLVSLRLQWYNIHSSHLASIGSRPPSSFAPPPNFSFSKPAAPSPVDPVAAPFNARFGAPNAAPRLLNLTPISTSTSEFVWSMVPARVEELILKVVDSRTPNPPIPKPSDLPASIKRLDLCFRGQSSGTHEVQGQYEPIEAFWMHKPDLEVLKIVDSRMPADWANFPFKFAHLVPRKYEALTITEPPYAFEEEPPGEVICVGTSIAQIPALRRLDLTVLSQFSRLSLPSNLTSLTLSYKSHMPWKIAFELPRTITDLDLTQCYLTHPTSSNGLKQLNTFSILPPTLTRLLMAPRSLPLFSALTQSLEKQSPAGDRSACSRDSYMGLPPILQLPVTLKTLEIKVRLEDCCLDTVLPSGPHETRDPIWDWPSDKDAVPNASTDSLSWPNPSIFATRADQLPPLLRSLEIFHSREGQGLYLWCGPAVYQWLHGLPVSLPLESLRVTLPSPQWRALPKEGSTIRLSLPPTLPATLKDLTYPVNLFDCRDYALLPRQLENLRILHHDISYQNLRPEHLQLFPQTLLSIRLARPPFEVTTEMWLALGLPTPTSP